MKSQQADGKLSPGTGRCKCMKCGRYFSSTGNFDRHQRIEKGQLTCINPEDVGMSMLGSGFWGVPMPDDVKERLYA